MHVGSDFRVFELSFTHKSKPVAATTRADLVSYTGEDGEVIDVSVRQLTSSCKLESYVSEHLSSS